MGHKQTAEHRFGKGSFHQIGLVRGQFGNVLYSASAPAYVMPLFSRSR